MKNIHKLLFIFIIFTVLLVPSYSVKADPTNSIRENLETELKNKKLLEDSENNTNENAESDTKKEETVDCNGIFGNPNDPNYDKTTLYMIQKILNYIKVLAPLLVVLLSGFDFAKNALSGDQDEMKKAAKKLGIRLACAVGVFLAPLLTGFLINFINNSSIDPTCNIK